ncbi:MAG: M14 family zinc carboxypeptidase, partial [Gemmatimonadota bacterium]
LGSRLVAGHGPWLPHFLETDRIRMSSRFSIRRLRRPVTTGRSSVTGLLFLAIATARVPGIAAAQSPPPSPEEFLGYPAGGEFTSVRGIESYAAALAAASSRVSLLRYGATPEGRPLLLLVIGRTGVLEDYEPDLARLRQLTDPALSEERARAVARETRAVVWLTYGIHGDESSSSEAALWTAWDLATGRDGLDALLDSLIVVIDPVANPDGRDRYVNWYRSVRGAEPNPEVSSAEHMQPWPGGRFNHFLFDLNRDWIWASQSETRARIAQFDRWSPAVHVDFHEMGHESSYFFFPAAAPVSPLYPESTARWAERFGRANAREFDRRRWLYFTAEQFDLFYPGYGDSWPSLVGSIGMTYEQAGGATSSRGAHDAANGGGGEDRAAGGPGAIPLNAE